MPAGKGSSPLLPGGIGHHACRHHDRHARCIAATGAGVGGITPPLMGAALREAWSGAESLGCVSPLDKSRSGTPEGVRVPLDARRAPSSVLPRMRGRMKVGVRRLVKLRLSAFCFLSYFFLSS